MLDLAYKYRGELSTRYREIPYTEKYKFYNYHSYWSYDIAVSDSSWDNLDMVSLSPEGRVLGFFRAAIKRETFSVHQLYIINFGEPNPIFSRDMSRFLKELFTRHNFRKVEFSVICGNPAEKLFDKLCERYDGRIVGTKRLSILLSDGQYYDEKWYEFFGEDVKRCLNGDKQQ
ncbi:MAG: hypothetical protein IJY82_02750 [Oscillospiraceae bacterium]|nr:hypothetical protein [Oscillospiraceae bacterium]